MKALAALGFRGAGFKGKSAKAPGFDKERSQAAIPKHHMPDVAHATTGGPVRQRV